MKTNLRWAGGKHYQKKDIVSLVQKDCEIFIDAFCGGLSVTLELENSPHRLDVANDLFDELINYYNVVKFHPKDLYNKLREIPYSVTSFDWASDWKYTEKYSLPPDEIEYAAKFFIRNRMSRDGLGKEFTTSPRLRRGMPEMESSYLTAIESIFDLHNCIREKIFCRLNALHLIKCFKDYPECTIYCDPPYYYSKTSKRRTKHLYAVEVDQLFHSIFLNYVMNSKAQIIISGYSEELYEDALSVFERKEKIVNMNMGGGTDKKAKRTEILWYNRL